LVERQSKMNIKSYLLVLILSIASVDLAAQEYYLPLNNEINLSLEREINRVGSNIHTAVKPYLSSRLQETVSLDSLNQHKVPDSKFFNSWLGRKFTREHLLQVKEDDFSFFLDFNVEFTGGIDSKDTSSDSNFFINSRGFNAGGSIGDRFSFSSSFVESQASLPTYLDSLSRATRVVPGGGRIKKFQGNLDYAIASGSISYSLKKYFNFQAGTDKNFIGDGYRSLLLSDHAFNYPYLKINMDIWKINYTVLYSVHQLIEANAVNDEVIFRRKYASTHYLDFQIGKRVNLGIMESIIYGCNDGGRACTPDIHYFNPVIFFRPVEFSVGSPDNALMGLNLKVKVSDQFSFYGQMVLDELKLSEVRAGNGWWANKQGFQLGLKTFEPANIKNLYTRVEFNYVRPYTYQHRDSLTGYSQYNHPLAHPSGANFYEMLAHLNYSYKRFILELKMNYIYSGTDTAGVNYGQNILLPYTTHPNEFGNEVGQGYSSKITIAECRFSYLINPINNFRIELFANMRRQKRPTESFESLTAGITLRTLLSNRYFDF